MSKFHQYYRLFKERTIRSDLTDMEKSSLEYKNSIGRLMVFAVKSSLISSLFFIPFTFVVEKYISNILLQVFIACSVLVVLFFGIMRMFWTREARRLGISYKEIMKLNQ